MIFYGIIRLRHPATHALHAFHSVHVPSNRKSVAALMRSQVPALIAPMAMCCWVHALLSLSKRSLLFVQLPRSPLDLPGSTPPPFTMSRGPPKKFHSFESKYWPSSSSTSYPAPLSSPSNHSVSPATSHKNEAGEATSGLACFTCGKHCSMNDMKVICAKERYEGEGARSKLRLLFSACNS